MATSKLKLPQNYLKWLGGIGEDALVSCDGREWELADRETLLEVIHIDGRKAPYVEQITLYVESLAAATGESGAVDSEGNEIPFSRLEKFLTIGYDNEDLLCVDPADGFSVWCFSPSEGGGLERLADSLDAWREQAEPSG